jgi:hypothetical protein
MSFKTITRLIIFVAILTLSACAQAQDSAPPSGGGLDPSLTAAKPTPTAYLLVTPVDLPPPQDEIIIRDHSQARDAVVEHVALVYDLEQPLTWEREDLTKGDLVGWTAFRYTAGPWVVQVSAPVVALENVIYTVVVDHLQAGVHWEGLVNAYGDMAEGEVAPLAAVTSPEAARDMALSYISRNYQVELPLDWNTAEVPQSEAGITRYRYISGAWAIEVIEPASAPMVSDFSIAIENDQGGFHWQGAVTSQGVVSER